MILVQYDGITFLIPLKKIMGLNTRNPTNIKKILSKTLGPTTSP